MAKIPGLHRDPRRILSPTHPRGGGRSGLGQNIVKKTGCSLRAFQVLGNGLAAELPNCPPDLLSLRFHTGFILVSYPVSYLNRPFQVPPQICQPQILALCMKTPQSRLRLNLGPLASANVGDLGCLLCFPGVWLAGSQCVVSYPVSYRRLGRPVGYVVHFRIALTGRAPRIRCAGPRGWNLCSELGPRGLQRAVSYPVSYRFHTLGFIPRFHTGFIPVSYRTEKQAGFIPG